MPLFRLTTYWQRIRPFVTSVDWWLNALSAALLACIVFGSLLGRCYFLELFSHFWIQYGLATGLLSAVGIVRWGMRQPPYWILFVGPSVVLLWFAPTTNGIWWVPGDEPGPVTSSVADVRVYQANVLYSRHEHETTVAQLRSCQPDLFVLQEMTPASIRFVTAQLQAELPYWFACWSKKNCWTLVGSRTPIRANEQLARTRQIIVITTQVRRRPMSLITVHPRVPLLPSWFRQRNAQLAEVARLTRHNTLPTVLIGDFNISVFSPIYTNLFGPSSAGVSRKTATLTSGRQQLTQPTWPNFLPSWLMIPIDHAFVNSSFQVSQFQTVDQSGSDHRALVVDLRLRQTSSQSRRLTNS